MANEYGQELNQKPKGQYTEGICKKCGLEGISGVKEIEDIDYITISSNGKCKECNHKEYEAKKAKYSPYYARKIARHVKPKYQCPMQCPHEYESRKELIVHLTEVHNLYSLEQQAKHYSKVE